MSKEHLQTLLALAEIATKTGQLSIESYVAVANAVAAARQTFAAMDESDTLKIAEK